MRQRRQQSQESWKPIPTAIPTQQQQKKKDGLSCGKCSRRVHRDRWHKHPVSPFLLCRLAKGPLSPVGRRARNSDSIIAFARLANRAPLSPSLPHCFLCFRRVPAAVSPLLGHIFSTGSSSGSAVALLATSFPWLQTANSFSLHRVFFPIPSN